MSIRTCPTCGAQSDVVDSRSTVDQCRRRYLCPKGHRYSTIEIVADGLVVARDQTPSSKQILAAMHDVKLLTEIEEALRDMARSIVDRRDA